MLLDAVAGNSRGRGVCGEDRGRGARGTRRDGKQASRRAKELRRIQATLSMQLLPKSVRELGRVLKLWAATRTCLQSHLRLAYNNKSSFNQSG